MSKPSVLIDAGALRDALQSQSPPLVLDCRARLEDAGAGLALWQEGHIPGSLPLDMDQDLSGSPGNGGRHPLPTQAVFTKTLQRLGIDPRRAIVVYDDRGGQLAAARAWWMLACWAGHPDVRVLNGGWTVWQKAAFPADASHDSSPPVPSSWRPTFRNEALISLDSLADAGGQLIDARSQARFRGDEEPIDSVAGHIPGAICRPAGANLNVDGTFKSADELSGELPQAKSLTSYCGSGISACHNILAYAVAGLPLPRLYVGSWSEWIRDPARPIATGDA